MATAARPRTYHNTAMLLPDGRVLVGGHAPISTAYLSNIAVPGANPNPDRDPTFEIYEPPYLFWGDRPEITSGPEEVAYGQLITLGVGNAHEITGVVLMRPGATTHVFDSEQRGIELGFGHFGDNGVVAFMPPDSVVAPPGWYMLFVVKADEDDRGRIPSEAHWVHLSSRQRERER
jgi:hypothetical protein